MDRQSESPQSSIRSFKPDAAVPANQASKAIINLGWCTMLAKKNVAEPVVKRPVRCHDCGGDMQLVGVTDSEGGIVYNHPLKYLDSG